MINCKTRTNLNTPPPLYFTMNPMNVSGNVQPAQPKNNIIKKNLIESYFNSDKSMNNQTTSSNLNSDNSESQKDIKNVKNDNKSSSVSNVNSFKNQDIQLDTNKMKQNKEKDDKELDNMQSIFGQSKTPQFDYDAFDLSGDEFNEFF